MPDLSKNTMGKLAYKTGIDLSENKGLDLSENTGIDLSLFGRS
jgi:hypothetical protein